MQHSGVTVRELLASRPESYGLPLELLAGRTMSLDGYQLAVQAHLNPLASAGWGAKIALDFGNPLELLVATILSAQCTDEKVNEVTATLFTKYRTAQDYLAVPEDELRRVFNIGIGYCVVVPAAHSGPEDLVIGDFAARGVFEDQPASAIP